MKRHVVSRRSFLGTVAAAGFLPHAFTNPIAPIDRAELVRRHNPAVTKLDPLAPLSIGNGEFAFTADITGLQTFAGEYERQMPLCTMAQWGWHTSPLPSHLDRNALRLVPFDTFGRSVGYAVSSEGQAELFNWLRENPHRLHLGRFGLILRKPGGQEGGLNDIAAVDQRLDLWTGTLVSRFTFQGKPVTVTTAVHPKKDLLAVAIESPLISEKRLAVRLTFPYGSSSMQAADWQSPANHISRVSYPAGSRAEIERRLDQDRYQVSLQWDSPAKLEEAAPHEMRLEPSAAGDRLSFVASFAPRSVPGRLPRSASTISAAASHWARFWSEGGAVELAQSRDARAPELERRIVLSQYLTAIQCSGSQPPQETGLTVNSWYGKFHLEMHWWHAAHFALWQRNPMLERSLGWYSKILPSARARAKEQGYAGARWPKMVGPEGRDSPSAIGPLLIWQQPHPIFYAELCYQADPGARTLNRYRSIVFESADFMASFAHQRSRGGKFVLGPPLIPAQENHPPRETWNPTFELEYWSWGLKTAQQWRKRLGLARNPAWDRVIDGLAPLPVRDGVYLAHENCPQTFTERNHDHPSMLAALGVLPGTGVDRETMRRTLLKTNREWQWDKTWGWDYPMTAMTAARLGEPKLAVDALLLDTEKNRYLPNGHNWQRPNLPCYLPGNGGLLYAIAMMASGWKGAPVSSAPGFPSDGSWIVRWERLSPASI